MFAVTILYLTYLILFYDIGLTKTLPATCHVLKKQQLTRNVLHVIFENYSNLLNAYNSRFLKTSKSVVDRGILDSVIPVRVMEVNNDVTEEEILETMLSKFKKQIMEEDKS